MFDPLYVCLVLIPGLALSGLASWMVRAAFNRYSRVSARSGMTGAQAAQRLLDRAGIHDVRIVPAHGHLSDHYNPSTKELALSAPVFGERSIAAIGVATHEAGHAIQHAQGYLPLGLRSAIVPLAQTGSSLGYIVMVIGLIMLGMGAVLGKWVVAAGAVLFTGMLLFQLVTLPVEFDASARAKKLVVEAGIVGADERTGIDRVLNAAALTYVAAAVTTFLTLIYFLMRAGLLRGSND
jgi:Zn-dependent membrane protease YugP